MRPRRRFARPLRRVIISFLTLAGAGLGLGGCQPGSQRGTDTAGGTEPASSLVSRHAASRRLVSVRAPDDATLLEAPARVVSAPESRVELRLPFAGQVEEVMRMAGDQVSEGDPMLAVRVPSLALARARHAGLDRRLEVARARREALAKARAQGLVQSGELFELEELVTRLEADLAVEAATLALAGAAGSARGASSRRGLVTLVAPVSGVVESIVDGTGVAVEPGGAPLAVLVGAGGSRIEATLMRPLPPGSQLEFTTIDGRSFALEGTPVSTLIDPLDGSVRAWYDLRGPDPAHGDFPMAGTRGRLRQRALDPTLWQVPVSSLRFDSGWAELLVAGAKGELEAVRVEVVSASTTNAIVRGPVDASVQIAVEAAAVLDTPQGGHDHG